MTRSHVLKAADGPKHRSWQQWTSEGLWNMAGHINPGLVHGWCLALIFAPLCGSSLLPTVQACQLLRWSLKQSDDWPSC